MRRRIAVILLAAMMTGCGNAPPCSTEIPDAATEAACIANAPQTVGEKGDKENADEVQVTEELLAVPATEAAQMEEDAPEELTVPEHTCRWDGGSVTRPATCGSEGILTYACNVCGKTRTDSIAKTAHGSTVTVPAFGQQEPDCFWGANYDVKCETCGEHVDTIYKEALGHAGDEGVVTCQPDCTGGGSIKYTCTRCGFEWSEMYGQVQPHTWVEGLRKETDWLNGGVKEIPYLYCSVCGERQESVSAEGKSS